MRIYILTYASVSIHNNIYLFNINSRKLDGHYRSWSEYLNERYICMHTWQVNKIGQYYNVHHWHVLKSYRRNIISLKKWLGSTFVLELCLWYVYCFCLSCLSIVYLVHSIILESLEGFWNNCPQMFTILWLLSNCYWIQSFQIVRWRFSDFKQFQFAL